jgi:hypothetical protein
MLEVGFVRRKKARFTNENRNKNRNGNRGNGAMGPKIGSHPLDCATIRPFSRDVTVSLWHCCSLQVPKFVLA